MQKQIFIRSLGKNKYVPSKLFNETVQYLQALGFKKTPVVSMSKKDGFYSSILFEEKEERIVLEFNSMQEEQIIKLSFAPLNIEFIYDILLMRFNQIARIEKDTICVYSKK